MDSSTDGGCSLFDASSATKFCGGAARALVNPSGWGGVGGGVVPGDFLLQGGGFGRVELDSQTHGEGGLSCREPEADVV